MRDDDFADVPNMVVQDMFRGMVGKLIGRGASRAVYEWTPDPKLVVKIEIAATFQNVMEWEIYDYLRGEKAAEYFAEPVWIGSYGSVMLMKKTQPINDSQLPKLLPDWISDRKRENFGWLDGKVVCHDYGVNNIVRYVNKKIKFRAVDFSEWR